MSPRQGRTWLDDPNPIFRLLSVQFVAEITCICNQMHVRRYMYIHGRQPHEYGGDTDDSKDKYDREASRRIRLRASLCNSSSELSLRKLKRRSRARIWLR